MNFRTLTLPVCVCMCIHVCAYIYLCTCARMYVCIRGLKIALTIYIFSLFNFPWIDVRYNVIIWITHVGSFNLYVVSQSYLFGTLFFPEKNPSRTCFTSECFFEIIYLHKIARNETKFPTTRLNENITEVFCPQEVLFSLSLYMILYLCIYIYTKTNYEILMS